MKELDVFKNIKHMADMSVMSDISVSDSCDEGKLLEGQYSLSWGG